MRAVLRLFVPLLLGGIWAFPGAIDAQAQSSLPPGAPRALKQFHTDLSKRSVDLSELKARRPPKDGIPSIDDPSFVSIERARDWTVPEEPVIALEHGGVAKAYPLQILTHHEVVNDRIGGTPVAVTFCPLCYSALVFKRPLDGMFDRRVDGRTLRFSDVGEGRFRDGQTGSRWTVTGTAVEGPLEGTQLDRFQQGDYFAFVWFAFRPTTTLYDGDSS